LSYSRPHFVVFEFRPASSVLQLSEAVLFVRLPTLQRSCFFSASSDRKVLSVFPFSHSVLPAFVCRLSFRHLFVFRFS
jgi:hypothetical protein